MQLEAEVTDGNAIADSDISEGCVVDYARHFAIDNIQDCDWFLFAIIQFFPYQVSKNYISSLNDQSIQG